MPSFPPLAHCRSEYRVLAHCCVSSADADGSELAELIDREGPDLDLLVDLADWQCVAPLAYDALRRALPEGDPALAPLEARYREASLRYLLQASSAREALSLLEEHGLDALAYKGLALAEAFYGDPALRPMGDLDLWLPQGPALEADRLLREHGWYSQDDAQRQETTRASHHHLPRLTSPEGFVSLEIHRLLHELDDAGRSQGYLERATRVTLRAPTETDSASSFEIGTLGAEDHLISLATHFGLDRTVYYQSYAALRQLTDLHRVTARSSVNWSLLERLAHDASLTPFVWLGLESAFRLFDTPVPDQVRRSLRAEVPRAEEIERFIDCKVLEPSPWVLHQLVDPDERSTWALSKALLRRFFWDPLYLQEKFGERSRQRYRRHASDMLATVTRMPSTLDQLRVDGWMAELHQLATPH